MTRLLLLPAILALAATAAQATAPDAVDPKLAALQKQCELDSQDTNLGGVAQSCLDFETARAKQPAAAAPSLEKCAYDTLHSQNGISQACSDLLDKANKSGEMAKRGGLTAVAKAYKGQPGAVQGDQPAAAPRPDKTAPVDEEFKGLPDAQARELSSLKKQCAGTTLGFWNAGDYALGGPCKELAGKRDAAMRQLDKACETYKDLDVGQMDTAAAKETKEACVNRGDQKLGIDRKKLTTPQQCTDALAALNAPSPGADAKQKRDRLADLCAPVVGDMLKNWDHKSPLPGLAVFQWDCAHFHHEAMCLATGEQKQLPAKLPLVPAAAPAGNDAAAIAGTFFHNDPKMKDYFEKNPEKAKSFNAAYAGCKSRQGRAADDCMVELQRNWLIQNPGTANSAVPDKFYKKAPGKRELLQAIIDRQSWDDQMKKRFDGNLDKMSPSQFERNYAGVLSGRPRTEAGRQYLRNACQGMPDWSKDEAVTVSELRTTCKRFSDSQSRGGGDVPSPRVAARARRSAPSAPVMTPEKSITSTVGSSIADALSPLLAPFRQQSAGSGYYNRRTRQECWNWPTATRVGDPDCLPK